MTAREKALIEAAENVLAIIPSTDNDLPGWPTSEALRWTRIGLRSALLAYAQDMAEDLPEDPATHAPDPEDLPPEAYDPDDFRDHYYWRDR